MRIWFPYRTGKHLTILIKPLSVADVIAGQKRGK